jgi:hypothetical protein
MPVCLYGFWLLYAARPGVGSPFNAPSKSLSLSFLKFFIRYFLYIHFKCYPRSSLYPPPALLPNPLTPASWPWLSPILRHIKFVRPRASLPNDGWLGHLLLHMQLETRALGVLVSSYCCSTYRVADPPPPSFFWVRVSLYSPGCPGTHLGTDQAVLELRNPPASASQVLELKAFTTTAPENKGLFCI